MLFLKRLAQDSVFSRNNSVADCHDKNGIKNLNDGQFENYALPECRLVSLSKGKAVLLTDHLA